MIANRRTFLSATAAGALALPLVGRSAAVAATAPVNYTPKLMSNPKFVDVDGIKTRYFEAGSGKALVLVHGGQWPATSSAEAFGPIFDYLAAHYHVYAFDKLGMGFTALPKTDADYSMDGTVRHAYGFIKAVGITSCILAGHSRGALPATRIAVDHPELVSHLIIFDTNALASDGFKLSDRPDPVPSTHVPTRDEIRAADLASPLSYNKAIVTDALVDSEYRIAQLPQTAQAGRTFTALRDKWIADHPEQMKTSPQLGNNMGPEVWWMIDNKHETIAAIKAGKLKPPVAIIWGWNDPFAPYALGLDTMKTIGSVNSAVEMHFVNHSGHYVFAEQPVEVTRLITSFVAAYS